MRELSKVIYAPFKHSLAKYPTMESLKLLSTLSESTSKDILDELRAISMALPKLISNFTDASERCLTLTEGCYYPGLISAFEDCLGKFLDRFTTLVKRLEKRKNAAHSWNILQQSLTLNQTCGDLLLHLEQMDINLSIAFLDKTKYFMVANDHAKAIQQHNLFLLDSNSTDMKSLQEFHSVVKQGKTLARKYSSVHINESKVIYLLIC